MFNKLIIISTLFFVNSVFAADYVPGELIVKFKKSSNISSYARVSGIAGSDFKVMKISKGKDVMQAAAELSADPNVEYAEPNYIFHISATPNDTLYAARLWGLNNSAQTISGAGVINTNNPGNVGDDINAQTAWDIITDCSAITVAVIDTGVKYTHEDLINNMWDGGGSYPNHGWDFYNNDNDPLDDNGHGSHVSGIIGAQGNNSKGVTGVCWRINIMALKAFNASGEGGVSQIIPAIDFAISNGANIINSSFNMYGAASAALSEKITEAEQAGILFVSAAGNGCPAVSGCEPSTTAGYDVDTSTTYPKTYPCCFTQDNILCVAAIDQKFQQASFSNYGSTSVDVAAPGVNIWSTWYASDSSYYLENGTSMATPYVVGVAALVWAQNPTFTYLDVKNTVMYGGTAISSMSGKSVSGNVISAYGSLNYINVPTGLTAVVNQ